MKLFSKALFTLMLCGGFIVTSCYDDSELRGILTEHDLRIKELERLCSQTNTNIEALQTIVTALQDKDYVTSVAPIKEGDKVLGYTITFSKSGAVTIYDGKDGKDGYVPVLGVKQDGEQWYWTVDGEWLTDADGNKVRASAKDGQDGKPGNDGAAGVTPTLKIEDGCWYVSYDGGKTWESESLGQATGDKGDSMFEEVTYDEDYVYLTMNDGQELQIPRYTEKDSYGLLELDSPEMFYYSAIIKGCLNVPASDLAFAKVTVYYTSDEVFNIHKAYSDSEISFDSDKGFAITLSNLQENTIYNYCVVAEVKSETVYSDVLSFTTLGELPSLKLQDVETVSDLQSVRISGKISGIESVELSKVGLSLYIERGYSGDSFECMQISDDGEFRFEFDVDCSSAVWKHGASYSYSLSLRYCDYSVDVITGNIDVLTLSLAGSVNATTISATSAVIEGHIDNFAEISACQCSSFQVGVSCGTSSNLNDNSKYRGELNEAGSFTISIDNLEPSTKYYYGLVIVDSKKAHYGDVKTFTTLKHPYELSYDLNMSSSTDLSSSGSANCYIVSNSGLYKFKPVKGNSSESVGNVASASILWETFGTSETPGYCDLIKAFCYKDDYIVFQTADTFKEGNAVIAAKDANGNILWSWHIWLTDQPQGQVYYNNAGTMMDRNLGATSATPGDVGALGLLYQWGRKDPFLGSSSISSNNVAKSTLTWPSEVSSDSSTGTIAYATANPTAFITYNSSNYDWYYTGSSSTDNTRWTTSETTKSIYDPCPSGWRVPDGGSNGVWSKAFGSSSSFTQSSLYDSTNEGMNFSDKFGSASTIWYPASGCRDYNDGSLYDVGYYGSYWSASPYGYNACRLCFSYDGYVNPSSNRSRAYGQSVRCLQAID